MIYKLLPLREQEENNEEVFVSKYAEDLTGELMGALETYPCLQTNRYYVSIVNTAQFLTTYPTDFADWRAKVLKMLSLRKKAEFKARKEEGVSDA